MNIFITLCQMSITNTKQLTVNDWQTLPTNASIVNGLIFILLITFSFSILNLFCSSIVRNVYFVTNILLKNI
ncbi:hypothetical protein BpHYR1_024645 [Brachionus plicatilis]|uniref:Uncharacterized protein n=1 Tax=Brachionus plicatilis TaxID=10195 RepID=A0A3M7SGP8_BRAPC|nr:hypothetical protein BpHYR1_024645 [Brachionus plicatilis]